MVVVIIPKPDKTDYTLPKAYHPISLLECMSKLLEKVVANRIQHDITALDLVPTNQFSGRQHSSCTDTGLTLLHNIGTSKPPMQRASNAPFSSSTSRGSSTT